MGMGFKNDPCTVIRNVTIDYNIAWCNEFFYNVQFQKINIPTPRKVNGNSKEEVSKAQFFKGKNDTKLECLGRWGGSN